MSTPRRSCWSAETRGLLALGWPVMLTTLNWTIMGVTDIVVVGLAGIDRSRRSARVARFGVVSWRLRPKS